MKKRKASSYGTGIVHCALQAYIIPTAALCRRKISNR